MDNVYCIKGRILDKGFQEVLMDTFDSVIVKRIIAICINLKKQNHTNLYLTIRIQEEPFDIYMYVKDLDLVIPDQHPLDYCASLDPSNLRGFQIV